ncbi:hypothetical protein [Streptomyces sp. CoH17]|uniref:hypothetical protein n=1 Tax=Streptomyces sp. CoH17 TaxID=2992806 RepID=UPI0022721B46|nr:hypothetical protein [Streptomyces sp. CoH17]
MTSEEMENGQHVRYVTVGGQRIRADQLNDPTIRNRALDDLARQGYHPGGNGPHGHGNSFMQRMSHSLDAAAYPMGYMGGGMLSSAQWIASSMAKGEGGLATLAGKANPYLSAALIGTVGYQMGSRAVSNLNAMGNIRGGGVSEGFGYEMGIRMMALNPFINTEQARQITMTALNEGFNGKEFDTVTEFMAQNLKDMNMEVGQSMEILKMNVEEGGASLNTVNHQLQQMEQLAKKGNTSIQQLNEQYSKTSGTMVAAGASGQAAGEAGVIAGQMFQNEYHGHRNPLAGQGGDLITALTQSDAMNALLAQRNGMQHLPQAMPDVLGDTLPEEQMSVLQPYARQFKKQGEQGVLAWNMYLKQFGVNLDYSQSTALMNQLIEANPATLGKERKSENNKVTERKGIPWKKRTGSALGNGAKMVGNGLLGVVRTVGGVIGTGKELFTDDHDYSGQWDLVKESFGKDISRNYDQMTMDYATYHNEELENLGDKYGLDNLEYIDDKGKTHTLDDMDGVFNNKEVMDRISSGQYKLKKKDKSRDYAFTLDQYASGWDPDKGQAKGQASLLGAFTGSTGGESSGKITLELTPEASKLVKSKGGNTIYMTPNGEQALSGWNGATLNNAPPGE